MCVLHIQCCKVDCSYMWMSMISPIIFQTTCIILLNKTHWKINISDKCSSEGLLRLWMCFLSHCSELWWTTNEIRRHFKWPTQTHTIQNKSHTHFFSRLFQMPWPLFEALAVKSLSLQCLSFAFFQGEALKSKLTSWQLV